jgi:guanyl-specific ribonuclease Sa
MKRFYYLSITLLLLTTVFGATGCDQIPSLLSLSSNGNSVSINDLPDEAFDTIELIQNGGPYPYSQDGDVYQNREKLLPTQQDGYYHVYTVETPGASDRGDRRIVTARDGAYYYTDDHYVSFRTITGITGAVAESNQNQQTTGPKVGVNEISVNALPKEARDTLQLIKKGGPFPYKQDNTVFSNREGLLPRQSSGYYHEYTVITPGASNRGTRRVIAGKVGEYYYTSDHYASFKRIVE